MASTANKAVRPSRRSTGKTSVPHGFVNTVEALADDLGEEFIPTSDEEDALPPPTKRQAKKQKPAGNARARHPFNRDLSPPMRALSPQVKDEFPESYSLDLSELNRPSKNLSIPNTLSITLNVPKDQQGPIILNLDLAAVLLNAQTQKSASPGVPKTSKPKSRAERRKATEMQVSKFVCAETVVDACGWPNLPPELRNKIYDYIFADDPTTPFSMSESPHRQALKTKTRSGQFLRTCKQVYFEGSQILYSKTRFNFDRQFATRGHYWDRHWYEIGYRDCRQFLQDIGPANISYMRDITISFDDGKPSTNPRKWESDDLRFVYDEHLMACLQMLGEHGHMKTLKLSFQGRRETTRDDIRFLHNLQKLRADEVTIDAQRYGHSYYGYPVAPRVNTPTEKWIIEKIQRSEPLYLEKKRNANKNVMMKKKRKHADV